MKALFTIVKHSSYIIAFTLSIQAGASNLDSDTHNDTSNSSRLKIGVNAVYTDKEFVNHPSEMKILPSAFYESDRFYARGDHAGYNLKKTASDEYSLYAQYAGNDYNPKETVGGFRQLDKKESTIMLGISYLKVTEYGGIRAQIATDVLGESQGSIAKLAYLGKFGGVGKDKLSLYPSIGIQWQDENYNDYYYGVTDKEAKASTLKSYQVESSLHPFTSVVGMYDINDSFGLFLNQSAHFYADSIYNSPKIDGRITFSSAVGLTYTF